MASLIMETRSECSKLDRKQSAKKPLLAQINLLPRRKALKRIIKISNFILDSWSTACKFPCFEFLDG